jgi:hypothetical protein
MIEGRNGLGDERSVSAIFRYSGK